MADRIIINEVGPRDGLQSQDGELSLEQRRLFIQALLDAGIRHLEMGSFVSPRAVPQMAGTDDLARSLEVPADVHLSALVPNTKGYELAREAGVKTMAVVASATDTMNQKNIRMSLDQTMRVCLEIIERGSSEGVRVQAYLAVAYECPFEGSTNPAVVIDLAAQLLESGATELVVADTIGAANP
ncbi:MAG: hydroxymethylglutaryl-CoA lyase, partial [Gammaproteobacteria bacterium]|nr:hydroxymethylglutaryl-CoA lyase [Gammaproteobacteria bacterium]